MPTNTAFAECIPCGARLELARDGTQAATIRNLLAFLETHRSCRPRGDVVVKSEET
jgi:hypothetical protein